MKVKAKIIILISFEKEISLHFIFMQILSQIPHGRVKNLKINKKIQRKQRKKEMSAFGGYSIRELPWHLCNAVEAHN